MQCHFQDILEPMLSKSSLTTVSYHGKLYALKSGKCFMANILHLQIDRRRLRFVIVFPCTEAMEYYKLDGVRVISGSCP